MSERGDRELGRVAGAAQFAAAAVVAWALRPAADALAQRLIGDDRLHSHRARMAIATRDGQIATLRAEKEKAEHKSAVREARLAKANDELADLREKLRISEEKREGAQRRADLVQGLQQQVGKAERRLTVANQEASDFEQDLKSERAAKQQADEELESLREVLNTEKAKSSALAAALADSRTKAVDGGENAEPGEYSFVGIVAAARERFNLLEIPDAALKHIKELDRATNAAVRAEATWKALVALHEYAAKAEYFNGGFYEWCQHSDSPLRLSPAKVAMTESETVRKSAPLRDKRRFEVAREVDPSDPTGRMVMLAHLKPVEGGGEDIPRIYFHDDTGGRTKKIHIGAIAPHSQFPNTKS